MEGSGKGRDVINKRLGRRRFKWEAHRDVCNYQVEIHLRAWCCSQVSGVPYA